MNIIFLGSSKFAVACLRGLAASQHKLLCVVTQPDRKRGRGLSLEGTPVKIAAQEFAVEIFQPADINSKPAEEFLKTKYADIFVVVAFGQILSKEILSIPKKFCINAHASLLPKYRGAAPINWALIRGENKTGVTIIKMTEEMDAGSIIKSEELEIKEDDNCDSLEDKLSKLAANLLVNCIEHIENDDFELIGQKEELVSFAPKLKKENGLINWEKSARDIYNLIRGCFGWPGAFTFYKGRLMKIYQAEILEASPYKESRPGEIQEVEKDKIFIGTGKGQLIIKELQLEGKRIMTAADFIAGHKIALGDRLGRK